jgi:hypothetical protein
MSSTLTSMDLPFTQRCRSTAQWAAKRRSRRRITNWAKFSRPGIGALIHAHKKSAGMIYQAVLRNEPATTLGVQLDPVSKHGQAGIAGTTAGAPAQPRARGTDHRFRTHQRPRRDQREVAG